MNPLLELLLVELRRISGKLATFKLWALKVAKIHLWIKGHIFLQVILVFKIVDLLFLESMRLNLQEIALCFMDRLMSKKVLKVNKNCIEKVGGIVGE